MSGNIKGHLTNPQRRALEKLKSEWKTPQEIGELRTTLDSLVSRRFANRAQKEVGALNLPIVMMYRITPAGTERLQKKTKYKPKNEPRF